MSYRIGAELSSWRTAAVLLVMLARSALDPDRRLILMTYAEAIADVREMARHGWLTAATHDPRSPGAKLRILEVSNVQYRVTGRETRP
jgi:hypothetical protein